MKLSSFAPASVDARVTRRVGIVLASLAIASGLVSFLGWALDVPALTHWGFQSGIFPQPNTTVASFFAGLAVLLLVLGHTRTAAIVGLVPAVIGISTLFEHVSGIDIGIDRLLMFDRQWGQMATSAPGRMGPPAASALTFLGIGALLAAFNPRVCRIAPLFGILVMGIALLSLIGYLFGASALFTVPQLTAIALPTSAMLAILGAGLVIALVDYEPMRTLMQDSAAGLLARQSLPFVIVLPIALAFVRLKGEDAGLYSSGFGTSMLAVVLVLLLLALLWRGVSAVRDREIAQRLVEETLRERESQLQDADRRKDEFLATLAHELRNPLAPIANSLSILKHANVDPRLVERTRDMMERQVNHMVRLIDDLLDISRISSRKLELRLSSVDIASVIHQVVETCRPMIERARHEVTIDLPREPLALQGDPIRLAQVFGNLLNNSIKFTEPGGRIRISAERDGDDLVTSVEDNGLGIPTGQLENIFEIFAQVDRSIERSQGGLGIGLTLAKRLVELHGGRIAVTSDGPGKGSKFIVRMPMKLDAAHVAEFTPGPTATSSKLRILVVDDNKDNADSLAMLLMLKGNETHTVHDGEAAVEAASRFNPDAVLLDIGLPKLNGYEACRRIRARLAGRKMAIYAITGWGQEADRQKSREAGFDGHLVKPVDHDTLAKILANL